MVRARVFAVTLLAMLAFAANSILCRLALQTTAIDPATFAAIRLLSGAVMLIALVALRGRALQGNWRSAFALFAYAAGFSLAYVGLPAATGALLLFGAVQVTMSGHGLWSGERLGGWQVAGLLLALAGLVGLLLPGLSAPPLGSAMLMLAAGVAWGVYSLRAKGAGDPAAATAGNFLRSAPMAVLLVLLVLLMGGQRSADAAGMGYAIASGALASGLGYVLWYACLPLLRSTTAATVQLSVPVLAAIGGIVFLGEALTLRLVLASMAVLGGVAVVVSSPVLPLRRRPRAP